jgi:hypothetical protein
MDGATKLDGAEAEGVIPLVPTIVQAESIVATVIIQKVHLDEKRELYCCINRLLLS